MTWQNRIDLDYLLAEKGGVCVVFGDKCCTYIPNSTAPEGAFTEVMKKWENLRIELNPLGSEVILGPLRCFDMP